MSIKNSNPNTKLENLARFLSVVLGPQFWAPLLLATFILATGLSIQQMLMLLPILFILQIVIPIIYIKVATARGWIQNWDIPKREERYEFWLLISVTSFLAAMATKLIGTILAFKVLMILFILLTALVLISLVWKISFHMISAMGSALMINYLVDNKLTILYLGVPLVFWSRLILKRHTFAQLLVGGLVAFLIVEGGLVFIQET